MEILKKRGFSLIELLIGVAIIVILLSMALLGIGAIKTINENLSVDELIDELEFAKNDSQIKERKNEIEFFENEERYVIRRGDCKEGEMIEKSLSGNLKFASNVKFKFSKNGTPSNSDSIVINRNGVPVFEVTSGVGTSQIRLYKLK